MIKRDSVTRYIFLNVLNNSSNVSLFPQKYQAAQLFLTLMIIIVNVFWALKNDLWMIVWSCEDWSTDAIFFYIIT